jgi:hypothetical protein
MLAWLRGQVSPVFGAAVTDNNHTDASIHRQLLPMPAHQYSSESSAAIHSEQVSQSLVQQQVHTNGMIPNNNNNNNRSKADNGLSTKVADTIEDHLVCELPADFGEANPTDVARIIGE